MVEPPSFTPRGPEREVRAVHAPTVGGAPVATIIVLSTVVTTLAFIPFSVVLASGGSMPLSQGVFPLVGWLLGPSAGAVASLVGTLTGIFLAPHTAGIPALSLLGAGLGSLAAGAMGRKGLLRPAVAVVAALAYAVYVTLALRNGVHARVVLAGSIIDWSGILLFALPTCGLCVRWIGSASLSRVSAGLFLGTWMISGLTHACQCAPAYYLFNWPEPVWVTLTPLILVENLTRSLVGAVIGSGVISGLRTLGVLRPREAIY